MVWMKILEPCGALGEIEMKGWRDDGRRERHLLVPMRVGLLKQIHGRARLIDRSPATLSRRSRHDKRMTRRDQLSQKEREI